MSKAQFVEEEKIGLSSEEIKMGQAYMRKFSTLKMLSDAEVAPAYEMFLVGYTLTDIAEKFPQYPLGQLVMTAAQKKWGKERERMTGAIRDRIQAKVIKSVMDQIEFLTTVLTVTNVEHMNEMVNYIRDPVKNPKPQMKISSLKEYKEMTETLSKIVQNISNPNKVPLCNSLPESKANKALPPSENKPIAKEEDVEVSFDDLEV